MKERQRSIEVVEASLGGFADADHIALSERYRKDRPVAVVIRHSILPASTILFCSPRETYWCFLDPGVSDINVWSGELSALAFESGLFAKELEKENIGAQSLPYMLIALPGADQFAHKRHALNPWFRSVTVPTEKVDGILAYQSKWLQEFFEDACWSWPDNRLGETLPTGSESDGELLNLDPAALPTIASWTGSLNVAARLANAVTRLESDASSGLAVGDACMPIFQLPDRRIWTEQYFRAAWRDEMKQRAGVDLEWSLRESDRVISLRARLARLLGWSRLYFQIKAAHNDLRRSVSSMPLSSGLPYDPVLELEAYLQDQERKYPILLSSPFGT